jgi:hypothetical protein
MPHAQNGARITAYRNVRYKKEEEAAPVIVDTICPREYGRAFFRSRHAILCQQLDAYSYSTVLFRDIFFQIAMNE